MFFSISGPHLPPLKMEKVIFFTLTWFSESCKENVFKAVFHYEMTL